MLAPLLVAAGNYICLGRLIICALPCDSQRLFNLNPRFITKVFVTSDVLSFLVQASGSGVASSQNWTGKAGIDMLLAGLALQLTTNVVFMTLLAAFLKRAAFDKLVRDNAPNSWNLVAKAIVISIILIFVCVPATCSHKAKHSDLIQDSFGVPSYRICIGLPWIPIYT